MWAVIRLISRFLCSLQWQPWHPAVLPPSRSPSIQHLQPTRVSRYQEGLQFRVRRHVPLSVNAPVLRARTPSPHRGIPRRPSDGMLPRLARQSAAQSGLSMAALRFHA